jgi:hypothetical protein
MQTAANIRTTNGTTTGLAADIRKTNDEANGRIHPQERPDIRNTKER